jgi:hypothetical protein
MTDNINTARDSVLRRVQKLLAIANDDRANEHEAAAAAGQAEKLMRKFNIDFAQEISEQIKKGHAGENMTTADVVATAKDNGTPAERVPGWAQWIAVAVAGMHDCGARSHYTTTDKGKEACIRFFGYDTDVKVASWTYEYLVATVNRLCKQFRKNPRYLAGGRIVMNSYRNGMATGILHTIQEMAAERQAEQAELATSRALVVVKKQAIEDAFGEIKYVNKTSKAKFDSQAFHDGREAGKKIDVNRRAIGGQADDRARIDEYVRRVGHN